MKNKGGREREREGEGSPMQTALSSHEDHNPVHKHIKHIQHSTISCIFLSVKHVTNKPTFSIPGL